MARENQISFTLLIYSVLIWMKERFKPGINFIVVHKKEGNHDHGII